MVVVGLFVGVIEFGRCAGRVGRLLGGRRGTCDVVDREGCKGVHVGGSRDGDRKGGGRCGLCRW